MTWWQALILGIVEGLTEYLPVSSTGHLLLTQHLLKLSDGNVANAYAICIQAGAIMAVLGLYHRRAKHMALGLLGKDSEGLQLFKHLILAFLPAALIGFLFDDLIESYLFGLWPVAVAWFVGGVAILIFNPQRKLGLGLVQLQNKQALLIGLAQCLAMWPGTSRSLVTILAGSLLGLSLSAAIEFSFLLGVITLGAATFYKALQHGGEMLAAYGLGNSLLGFFAAWVSATIAIKWMIRYLNKHPFTLFAYWRISLAVVVGVLLIF